MTPALNLDRLRADLGKVSAGVSKALLGAAVMFFLVFVVLAGIGSVFPSDGAPNLTLFVALMWVFFGAFALLGVYIAVGGVYVAWSIGNSIVRAITGAFHA